MKSACFQRLLGRVVTAKRASLDQNTVTILVLLHEALPVTVAARNDGVPDHQGHNCCVIKKKDDYLMSSILHMCRNVYLCLNTCVYV